MPLVTTALNPKHKREVCRYWLNSRCTKGQNCEFLHALDFEKMPVCQRGLECSNSDCNLKHVEKIQQRVCSNYQLGFCSFGNRCAHAHVQGNTAPTVSAYWTLDGVSNAEYAGLIKAENSNWRRKKCDYFEVNKWCPYFDMCNFVH